MYGQALIFLFLLLSWSSCDPDGTKRLDQFGEDMQARAMMYLLSTQSQDGGWHSPKHGIMRGGEALTAFTNYALSKMRRTSDLVVLDESITQANSFLATHTNEQGVLGLTDSDIADYPNYASAYSILGRIEQGTFSNLDRRSSIYLAEQQFTAPRGIKSSHKAFGAWGFGEINLRKKRVGHVDLSHTRRCLQALKAANSLSEQAARDALTFLRKLQINAPDSTDHGGFYASTVTTGTNKAGQKEDGQWRPYVTTTADGVLALMACGLPRDHPRVRAGVKFINRNLNWEAVGGIPKDQVGQWHLVMLIYQVMVVTEVYAQTGFPPSFKASALRFLSELQDQNGSFSNPMGAPNKEDDPILATA
ncbi:MAG: hypothetical protein AAF840_11365, partial [Bacteroidota bacterium]